MMKAPLHLFKLISAHTFNETALQHKTKDMRESHLLLVL